MKILTLFLCLLSTMAFAEPKKEFQALYGSQGTLRDGSGKIAATTIAAILE